MLGNFIPRLGLLLLLYFTARLLFLVFNYSLLSFHWAGEVLGCFFYGIRFDLFAIAITNCVFIIMHFIPIQAFYTSAYQRMLKWLFYIVNIPCMLFNFIDLAYYRFTLKRTTADFFDYVTVGNDFQNVLPKILASWWYLLLLLGLLFVLIEYMYRKTSVTSRKPSAVSWLALPAVLALLVIAGRGGLQYKPISILSAAQYTSTQNVALVLNTPFTIIKSIGKKSLEEKIYFKDNELSRHFNPVNIYSTGEKFRPLNVVIIIMESFSKEYIGYFNDGAGYTPFLDSLLRQGLACTNAYANGKRSIEGVPAVLSGIQALSSNAYITSPYNANRISSLPLLLKDRGYSSAFFHGGNNGTMGFDNFVKMAGFQKYIGKNQYPGNPDDYDGTWGIYDEPFFNFYCNEMSKMHTPFVTAFFSLSSHHPYALPRKYQNQYPEGTLPIHKTISYSDMALQKFFDCAKSLPWYANTLFVITADHTGPSSNPIYQNKPGDYSIPILYYMPSDSLSGIYRNVTQQTDIVPTVLHYLHYDKPFKFYGSSIFDITHPHYALNYSDGIYQLITDTILLQFDGEKTIGYYNYKKDRTLSANLAGKINFPDKNETLLKAIIQDYNNSMIYNRLTETK